MTIADIVQILRSAPRSHTAEGLPYIQLSDTLATAMAQTIEDACNFITEQARLIRNTADAAIAHEMLRRTTLSGIAKDDS